MVRTVSGFVICQSNENGFSSHYLLYSKHFMDFIKIDKRIEEVDTGRWLCLEVFDQYFDGSYVLDYSNCRGFDNYDTIPPSFFAFARYFPLKHSLAFGEVLMAVKVKVKVNRELKRFEYECYEINPDHFLDPQNILTAGGFFDGRNFVVELQASLDGWIVRKVHEDPHDKLKCDELHQPVVPYEAFYLDQTDLPSVMTKYVMRYRKDLRDSLPSTSVQQHSLQDSPVIISDNSSSRFIDETPILKPNGHKKEKTLGEEAETVVEVTTKKEQPKFQSINDDSFRIGNPIELKKTIGTQGLEQVEFDYFLSERAEELWREDKANENSAIKCVGIVVRKLKDGVMIFTSRRNVANVFFKFNYSISSAAENHLQVGDVAFFDVYQRLPSAHDTAGRKFPYTHIALDVVENTKTLEDKVADFTKNVRSFNNLIEMKVEIDLTVPQRVSMFYDDDESFKKSESGRRYYILTAVNGLMVTIPCARLEMYLSSNFTAKFKLQAWAVRRRAIGNVCLHIGPLTETLCIYENKQEILPILNVYYSMDDHGNN